jgi:AraC-like DNA-binding protein
VTHELWLQAVVRETQIMARCALKPDPVDITLAAERFFCALPAPRTPLEIILLRGFVMLTAGELLRRLSKPSKAQRELFMEWYQATDVPALRAAFLSAIRTSTLARDPARTINSSPIVDEATRMLHAQLERPWTAVLLAKATASHPRTLERHFHRYLGLSVGRYLQKARLEEAIRLLSTSDFKVEAVARMVGFKSRSGLHQALIRATGSSARLIRARGCQ